MYARSGGERAIFAADAPRTSPTDKDVPARRRRKRLTRYPLRLSPSAERDVFPYIPRVLRVGNGANVHHVERESVASPPSDSCFECLSSIRAEIRRVAAGFFGIVRLVGVGRSSKRSRWMVLFSFGRKAGCDRGVLCKSRGKPSFGSFSDSL